MKRMVVLVTALLGVVLVQLTIVNGLPLPGGGVPDLVLLCAVSLGLIAGPRAGLVAGFFAGLALDLAPPASELVGQYALVLCVAGYLGGRMRFTVRQSALLAITAAALAAAVGEMTAAALSLVLDTPQVSLATVIRVLPSSVFYDAVLSPLVLFAAVRIAVALGVSVSQPDGSPAMESGGSAAPAALSAAGRAGEQRGRLGASRAAGGRWLVGETGADAPVIGAVGWLAGPARSRRARRERARLTATLTGATPRRGAFWVGTRPPGLAPVVPPATSQHGLSLLRLRSGVAGSAAAFAGLGGRSGQPVRAGRQSPSRRSRPVRLGLASEQRRRARAASRRGHAFSRTASGRPEAGLSQHGLDCHGVSGPDLSRIAFGAGTLGGSGRAAGKGTPRIAFGAGTLGGSGRAAGKGTPRIAFGTGVLPGSGGVTGRNTKKIGFGSGGLTRSGGAAARKTSRIAFGISGPGPSSWVGAGRPGPRFDGTSSRTSSGQWLAHLALNGSRSSWTGAGLPGASHRGLTTGPRRRFRRPRFGRGTAGYGVRHVREPKAARMRAGRWPLRRLPWLRRAGGRSAVWRIGTLRAGGRR